MNDTTAPATKSRRAAAPKVDHKRTPNAVHDAASARWEKYTVTAPALGFDPTMEPHKTVQVANELLDWLVVVPLSAPLPLWLWGLWYMGELARALAAPPVRDKADVFAKIRPDAERVASELATLAAGVKAGSATAARYEAWVLATSSTLPRARSLASKLAEVKVDGGGADPTKGEKVVALWEAVKGYQGDGVSAMQAVAKVAAIIGVESEDVSRYVRGTGQARDKGHMATVDKAADRMARNRASKGLAGSAAPYTKQELHRWRRAGVSGSTNPKCASKGCKNKVWAPAGALYCTMCIASGLDPTPF